MVSTSNSSVSQRADQMDGWLFASPSATDVAWVSSTKLEARCCWSPVSWNQKDFVEIVGSMCGPSGD